MPRTKYIGGAFLTKDIQAHMGIDNGVSGSIGILFSNGIRFFFKVPTKSEQSYTKAKNNITRIDTEALLELLSPHRTLIKMCLIERPMVNPARFKASGSALRALEAVLIVLERLEIPLGYIDSKEWQKALLPVGIKGSPELKKASADIGSRMFPHCVAEIKKQKDADGILIAEYCRRTYD